MLRFWLCITLITPSLANAGELVFSNFFGSSGSSSATAIARDGQGNIYVAGQTNSTSFPVLNGFQNHPGAFPLSVSSNGGQAFTTVRVLANTVSSIAAAPGSPTTLYASSDTGVLKSTDGGTNWTTTAGAGLNARAFEIAVDASSPNRCTLPHTEASISAWTEHLRGNSPLFRPET